MADYQDNETITFQAPSAPAIIFFGLFGSGVLLLGLLSPFPGPRLAWALFGLAIFIPSVLCLFESGRGAFRINREGIQQVTFLRKPRHLSWENVERIKWLWHAACFEGKSTRIAIRWTMVSKLDVARAKTFLERVLSVHFDLSVKPIRQWSFDPNLRSVAVWLSKLIGASIGGTVIIMIPLALLAFLHQPGWLGMTWFVLFLVACFWTLSARSWKEKRMLEEINPTWRLRKREELSR